MNFINKRKDRFGDVQDFTNYDSWSGQVVIYNIVGNCVTYHIIIASMELNVNGKEAQYLQPSSLFIPGLSFLEPHH